MQVQICKSHKLDSLYIPAVQTAEEAFQNKTAK